jgi:hypothetical protein
MRFIHHVWRVVSVLVPSHTRDEWLQEWLSEFHYGWGQTGDDNRGTLRGC